MPKKAVLKQNLRASKKETAPTKNKELTSSNKEKTSSIKSNRTHNDQNKTNKSPNPAEPAEDINYDDSAVFNQVLTGKNDEVSRSQDSRSQDTRSQDSRSHDSDSRSQNSRYRSSYSQSRYSSPRRSRSRGRSYSRHSSLRRSHSRQHSYSRYSSLRRSLSRRSHSRQHSHSRRSRSQSPRSRSKSSQIQLNSRRKLVFSSEYEAAAYVAERSELLKIANDMAHYDGLKMSDNEERNMESMKFQTFLKCMFFRTRHLTKATILKCIKLCFPSKKFTHKDITVLKGAANAAFRFYREALRSGLRKIVEQFIEDFKIEDASQIEQADVKTYLQEEVWRSFLNRFYEAINEEAMLTTEFKELIKITDLNRITLNCDIYDVGGILNLNDADFKAFLKKELDDKVK
ncbi:18300_t:CDS:2 [Gigaspora rosea]|nr:18300_t:CDS:2 [Gigaspora rosea]